ncbi:ASCH domain-containing protein [Sporolactobacillus putidus]|uniref:RNA-binding protein n=1 Tax=Sporolactobacillus putidus TaxID=492735 RepID=A0A917S7A0_9BACL|nr:ASCH domain-containing protein [Sporolactobacillus putidus]GGL61854.1 RNA-binding protein [Sporolactobacillus putidus]
MNSSAAQLWEDYRKINPDIPESCEAWAFGYSKETANHLAGLVLNGTKTATASNYTLYQLENDPLPFAGLYNIILDGEEKAVAIVKTTNVEVVPFDEVTEEHAHREGEGDRTLKYWREVHKAFFKKELERVNQEFTDKIPVVCENFRVVYKRENCEQTK